MFERNNGKHGTGRLRTALAIAGVTAVVASLAIVGTVAAQPGQRFLDVPRTHYAYNSIEWAVLNGITHGCGDGRNFCPEQTLNRAHMVTFLKHYHDRFHGTSSAVPTTTTTVAPAPIRVRDFGSGGLVLAGDLTAGTYRGTLSLVLRRVSGTHEGILEFTQVKVSIVDSGGLTYPLHTATIELDDYAAVDSPRTQDVPVTLTSPFSFRVGDNLNDIAPGTADVVVEIIDRPCTGTISANDCPGTATDDNSRFRRNFIPDAQWEVVLTLR